VDVREPVQFCAWSNAALIWKHGTPVAQD